MGYCDMGIGADPEVWEAIQDATAKKSGTYALQLLLDTPVLSSAQQCALEDLLMKHRDGWMFVLGQRFPSLRREEGKWARIVHFLQVCGSMNPPPFCYIKIVAEMGDQAECSVGDQNPFKKPGIKLMKDLGLVLR